MSGLDPIVERAVDDEPPTGSRLRRDAVDECILGLKHSERAAEAEAERDRQELERTQAVAGPEPRIRTDGGNHAERLNAQLAMAEDELEADNLHVGDHVQDRDDPDATMVVIRACEESAGEYYIGGVDESVAEYNDCDPDEDVYQVVFAGRGDQDLADLTRYPYPRSRLELVAPVHERDEENGGAE